MSNIQKYVKRKYDNGGLAQLFQNFAGQFSGENATAGFQELTGGQDLKGLFKGAMEGGDNAGANILSQAAGSLIGGGGGFDAQGILGKAVSGGGLDPFSMAGGALDTLADDQDATTYSVGEIGADVAGVGMGVGRILAGDVLGG